LEVCGPGEEFGVYDENLASVVVCRWDGARQAVGLGARDVLRLRLPRAPPAAHLPSQPPPLPPEPTKPTQPPAAEPGCHADEEPLDFDEENMPDLFETPAAPPAAKATEDTSPSVGTVRTAASVALGVAGSAVLVVLTGKQAGKELPDDGETLLQAMRDGYGSWDGSDVLCVESRVEVGGRPQSAALFERVRNTAHINFNHPDRPEFSEEFKISVSKDSTLSELKAKLAEQLELDCSQLHIARTQKSPMFKDEAKTLRDLGLAEINFLFVGHGAPCGVDESILRFAFYTAAEKGPGAAAKARDAFSHPAKGTSSVRSLRQALTVPLMKWASELRNAGEEPPFDAEALRWKQLRIRDGQAGKQFAVLRGERTLRSALLGFGDGRQVAVQVLDKDEELAPDDLILQLRPWRYETGQLFAPSEWIVNGTRSLADIRGELTARFCSLLVQATTTDAASETPVENSAAEEVSEDGTVAGQPVPRKDEEDRLEIVALPSAGPPFSVKRCASLKWGPSAFNASDQAALQRSLSDLPEIRDGAVLVLRSALHAARGPPVEPAAAKSASKAGAKGAPKAKSAAGGAAAAAAAKARAAGAKAGSGGAPATRREQALVIRVAHPESGG